MSFCNKTLRIIFSNVAKEIDQKRRKQHAQKQSYVPHYHYQQPRTLKKKDLEFPKAQQVRRPFPQREAQNPRDSSCDHQKRSRHRPMWCQSPLELCWPDKICWEILATPVDLIAGCFSSSKLALEVFFCVVFSRFTSQLSLVIGFSSPTSAIHVLSGLTNHQAMHETTQHSWNCSTFCHATMKFPWHKAVPPSLASTNQQDGLSFPHHQWQDSMGPTDSRSSCCSTCVNSLSWLLSSLPKRYFSIHPYQSIRIIQLHGPPVGNGQVSPKDLLRGQVDETVHIHTPQIQLSEALTEHRVFCLSDY